MCCRRVERADGPMRGGQGSYVGAVVQGCGVRACVRVYMCVCPARPRGPLPSCPTEDRLLLGGRASVCMDAPPSPLNTSYSGPRGRPCCVHHALLYILFVIHVTGLSARALEHLGCRCAAPPSPGRHRYSRLGATVPWPCGEAPDPLCPRLSPDPATPPHRHHTFTTLGHCYHHAFTIPVLPQCQFWDVLTMM